MDTKVIRDTLAEVVHDAADSARELAASLDAFEYELKSGGSFSKVMQAAVTASHLWVRVDDLFDFLREKYQDAVAARAKEVVEDKKP